MKAVYPGSFDPMTLGHLDIIERAARTFSRLTVLVSTSYEKEAFFTPKERVEMIRASIQHLDNVDVDIWTGLTIHYLEQKDLKLMVRGVRSSSDFIQEQTLSNINRQVNDNIDTVLFCCRPEYRDVSSRSIKELAHFKGPYQKFVTPVVSAFFDKKLNSVKE
ncbi:MAG: pantetheine-phosphate adenylyltransferase [Bdellovibrionaceae bacterium]|nr:pantetheine-phosphate adenylyltransferase [Pseudobdellovibrionaceae bacterium]